MIETIRNGLIAQACEQCDKYAEHYRVMGKPFPGPWSFDRHPWTREMHNCRAQMVVGQKAAQMGYTEAMLNIVFFALDKRKIDVLYALPAKSPDATDFSSSRFDSALENSDYLRSLFSSRRNVNLKRAGSNTLYIRGSRSRHGFKSIPTGLIVLDEVDEFAPEAVILVKERFSGYDEEERQLWMISTPSVPEGGINSDYLRSSQGKFFFTCPHCSRKIQLSFPESLVITGTSPDDANLKKSHLICTECKTALDHRAKKEYLSTGQWVDTYPDREIKGFHITQLYSSTISPYDLAYAYLDSQTDILKEQEFYNSKLGEAHIVANAKLSQEDLEACRGKFKMGKVGGFCTMGIDVGKNCYVEVVRWAIGKAGGDINQGAQGQVVYAGTFADFTFADTLMYKFKPIMTVVDQQPETRAALAFARRHPGRVKLCHYGNNLTTRDIIDHGETVTVDRTSWLDLSLSRFTNKGIYLPADIPYEYFKHLKNLVRVPRENKDGQVIYSYKNTGPDHYGHAHNYAEIALKCCESMGSIQNITEGIFG